MNIVLGLLDTGILSYTLTTSRPRILSSHMILIIPYESAACYNKLFDGSDKMSVANHLFHFLLKKSKKYVGFFTSFISLFKILHQSIKGTK